MGKRSGLRPETSQRIRVYSAVVIVAAVVIFSSLLIGNSANMRYTRQASGTDAASTIAVLSSEQRSYIPVNFVGFSMETADVCSFIRTGQTHRELATFMGNFSPFILRVGGNSADRVRWQPGYDCGFLPSQTIGKSAINDLFTYARKVGFQVIWTVNLNANDPQAASDEASYVNSVAGDKLLGIAIGNEPNEYKDNAYSHLEHQWHTYYSAIKQSTPSAPIIGPDTAGLIGCLSCKQAYFQPFIRQYDDNISLATMHYYPLWRDTATVKALLSRQTMNYFVKTVAFSDIIKTGDIPLIIDETNSVAGGGKYGVSDTFAAALWSLDYLYTAAESNVQGVYFHGSMGVNDGFYSPIGKVLSGIYAKPVYYGMYLYHLLASNGLVLKTSVKTPINFTAHATRGLDGSLHIILINKDSQKGTVVALKLDGAYRSATTLSLDAPSLSSRADGSITLGGAPILSNGTWSSTDVSEQPINGMQFNLTVQPYSAVALIFYK